jgi:hypothetical protein
MSKNIQLHIPKPCHENWDAMSPVEKGKFCGSCEKQVVDFTNMSDRQIAEFFKKPSTGSVCGRFMTDQLDREIAMPKKRIPWLKYFFQITLPAFLLSMKANGQQKLGKVKVDNENKGATPNNIRNDFRTMGLPVMVKDIQPVKKTDLIVNVNKEPVEDKKQQKIVEMDVDTAKVPEVCSYPIMGEIAAMPPPAKVAKGMLRGVVTDENGIAVPFASIRFGEQGGLMADADGSFTMKIKSLPKDNKLIISSVGFERKEITVSEYDKQLQEVSIMLHEMKVLPEVTLNTGGIICTKATTVGYISVVKGEVLRTAIQETKTNIPLPDIKKHKEINIYPNPAVSGGNINIGFDNLEEGYYEIHFLNISGQIYKQQQVWIDAEARILNIDIPYMAAGNYFLVLTNRRTGKKYTEKVVVQ